MTPEQQIGPRLRSLRTDRGVTLEALAARSGLTKGYLSKIETGKKLPPIATLSRISGALDADMVEPPVPPNKKNPKIHPLLSQQILDCVKIDPDDRPESMEFVGNRLELIADLLESPNDGVVGEETTEF